VAVSGYALPEDRRKALEAGFDRHLAKPVPIDQIDEVLALEHHG
jgi:CheY-like chemotaxis protein